MLIGHNPWFTCTHIKYKLYIYYVIYFRNRQFIEKWGTEYLLSHLPTLHAEHKGMTGFESQAHYINQALAIVDVPMHFYKLYKVNRHRLTEHILTYPLYSFLQLCCCLFITGKEQKGNQVECGARNISPGNQDSSLQAWFWARTLEVGTRIHVEQSGTTIFHCMYIIFLRVFPSF